MNLFDDFSIALLLTCVGSLLLMAEVFFPSGGLLGLFAGCALLGAIYSAFNSAGIMGGLAFATVEVILVPVLIYFGMQILPNTPMGKILVGSAPSAEEVLVDDERHELIGRVGVARSKLLPAGAVEIEGQVIDCVSKSQAIEPGEYVKVVEVRANRVVVRRAATDERPANATPDDLLARPANEIGLDDFDFDPDVNA